MKGGIPDNCRRLMGTDLFRVINQAVKKNSQEWRDIAARTPKISMLPLLTTILPRNLNIYYLLPFSFYLQFDVDQTWRIRESKYCFECHRRHQSLQPNGWAQIRPDSSDREKSEVFAVPWRPLCSNLWSNPGKLSQFELLNVLLACALSVF